MITRVIEVRWSHTLLWYVQPKGAVSPTQYNRYFGRQLDAIKRGRDMAKERRPSKLVVYNKDGKVAKSYNATYKEVK